MIIPHASSEPIVELVDHFFQLRRYYEASEQFPKKYAVDRIVCLLQVDERQEQRHARFQKKIFEPSARGNRIRRRTLREKPARHLRQHFLYLAVGAESRSDEFGKNRAHLCYE